MAHFIARLVERTAKALAKQVGGAAMVAITTTLPDGRHATHWGAAEADADDMVMAALSMLRQVEEAAAAGSLACEGCADRWTRARAAVAALQGEDGDARKRHAH